MKHSIKIASLLCAACLMSACSQTQMVNTYDATTQGKEILTPKAAETPHINSASVFGVRPGKPISMRVAASGVQPMSFSAQGLPAGVSIDAKTGWVTGRAPMDKGDIKITLAAKNAKGTNEQTLTLRVGDTIALTPPMGWNSWYVHSEGVNDAAIREMATSMNEKGLTQYGWTYVNIDDCWMGVRDPITKAIQPNGKFGDMKELSKHVNSQGLKLGIYSTTWMSTFAGYIGGSAPNADGDYSEFYLPKEERLNPYQLFGRHPSSHKRGIAQIGPVWFVDRDAKQFADWGIDYVKYDWVETPLEMQPNGHYKRDKNADAAVRKTDAITSRFFNDFRSLDRDIVLSLSPQHYPQEDKLVTNYANLWRLTKDIKARWSDLTRAFTDELVARYPLTRPGLYGDLDMLQIGPMGKPNRAHKEFLPSPLLPSEQYFQLTLWSILTQPLLISSNIPTMDDFDLNLITNHEVLAVNQDPLVKQGYRIENKAGSFEIWVKDLVDGSKAVALFNISDEEQVISVSAEKLGKNGMVRDYGDKKI